MPLTKKSLASNSQDAADSITGARARPATGAETAAYIDDMVREMEALARSRGLKQLSNLLRLARGEARLLAEEDAV